MTNISAIEYSTGTFEIDTADVYWPVDAEYVTEYERYPEIAGSEGQPRGMVTEATSKVVTVFLGGLALNREQVVKMIGEAAVTEQEASHAATMVDEPPMVRRHA